MSTLGGFNIPDTARGGVVAIGNFDGVHRGHQAMMQTLRQEADRLGTHAVAVTFDPAPVELLRPEHAPPRLMTLEDKRQLLRVHGADEVVALATSSELLSLTAQEFFDEVLRANLNARGIVEGPNFRFGKGREGDVERLGRMASDAGIAFSVVEPVRFDEGLVSSTRIRQHVTAGEMADAARLLGRPHRVGGRVTRGAARGTALGFPTANLGAIEVLLPPDGVYAGRVELEGQVHAVAIHLGPNSTFGVTERTFEVHVLDFQGDLYDQWLRVELVARVRASQKFSTVEKLVDQLQEDCRQVRVLVASGDGDR